MRLFLLRLGGVVGAVLASITPAAAQSDSREAARTLVRVLEERGLQAFAAEHPDAPGTFSAVLLIPGTQLLAITTAYAAVEQLRQVIAAGNYHQAYVDLQTAGAREGRLFVQDLRADGLRADSRDGEPFDVVSHDARRDVSYNGDWQQQQLTAAGYREAFARDDERYAAMLHVLTSAINDAARGLQHLAVRPAP
jgi:hypothetical protein